MKTNEKSMNTVEKSMKRSNYFGYAPTNSVAQTNLCEDYCGFTGFGFQFFLVSLEVTSHTELATLGGI